MKLINNRFFLAHSFFGEDFLIQCANLVYIYIYSCPIYTYIYSYPIHTYIYIAVHVYVQHIYTIYVYIWCIYMLYSVYIWWLVELFRPIVFFKELRLVHYLPSPPYTFICSLDLHTHSKIFCSENDSFKLVIGILCKLKPFINNFDMDIWNYPRLTSRGKVAIHDNIKDKAGRDVFGRHFLPGYSAHMRTFIVPVP